MAGLKALDGQPAPGLPPARGPDQSPRPAVLARVAHLAGGRDRGRRYLAQHPQRARPDAPGDLHHDEWHGLPAQRAHPGPAPHPLSPRSCRAASLLRLHPGARARQRGLNPDRPRSNTRSRSFTPQCPAQRSYSPVCVPAICGSLLTGNNRAASYAISTTCGQPGLCARPDPRSPNVCSASRSPVASHDSGAPPRVDPSDADVKRVRQPVGKPVVWKFVPASPLAAVHAAAPFLITP